MRIGSRWPRPQGSEEEALTCSLRSAFPEPSDGSGGTARAFPAGGATGDDPTRSQAIRELIIADETDQSLRQKRHWCRPRSAADFRRPAQRNRLQHTWLITHDLGVAERLGRHRGPLCRPDREIGPTAWFAAVPPIPITKDCCATEDLTPPGTRAAALRFGPQSGGPLPGWLLLRHAV